MLHTGLIIYHHIWIVALQLLYLCLYQTVHKAITALPLCASHYHQIIIIFLRNGVCQPRFQICLLRHSSRDLIAAVHTGSFNFLPQFSQCAFNFHTKNLIQVRICISIYCQHRFFPAFTQILNQQACQCCFPYAAFSCNCYDMSHFVTPLSFCTLCPFSEHSVDFQRQTHYNKPIR